MGHAAVFVNRSPAEVNATSMQCVLSRVSYQFTHINGATVSAGLRSWLGMPASCKKMHAQRSEREWRRGDGMGWRPRQSFNEETWSYSAAYDVARQLDLVSLTDTTKSQIVV